LSTSDGTLANGGLRGLQQHSVFQPHFEEILVELASNLAHQAMNCALHCGWRSEQPLAQALTGSAIDKDAIVTSNRDLKHALVVKQLIERPRTNKLGQCLLGQAVGLKPNRQRKYLLGLLLNNSL
jgi:hypothetical protein